MTDPGDVDGLHLLGSPVSMETGKVIRCGVVPECHLTEDSW